MKGKEVEKAWLLAACSQRRAIKDNVHCASDPIEKQVLTVLAVLFQASGNLARGQPFVSIDLEVVEDHLG